MACLRATTIGEFLYRPAASVCRSVLNSTSKCFSSSPEGEIKIPKRIPRSSTAILEALAATVSRDYTAPHYKFHDDPFLIPASNIAKRAYALSKESGKKAAKWIKEEYAMCFEEDPSEPQIKSLMPKPVYTDDNVTSTEQLLTCIKDAEVTSAIIVYDILTSKGVPIDNVTKQALFELLCFYNCKDPMDEDLIDEKWFRQSLSKDRNIWMDSSKADELFKTWENKDARTYTTMIRGLAKHLKVHQAWKLYEEMQEQQMPTDVDTYNSLLSIVCFLHESSETRWQAALTLLTNMHREGVKPNLGTFNAALETVTKLGTWQDAKKLALQIMAEMKQQNVEPSLGTFYFLLLVFCRPRGPVSTILYDIMNIVQNKKWEIRHPKDVFFFVTAMEVCHSHLQDKELAYQLNSLLHLGNNYFLIGDALKESIYYQHFFKLLSATEDIDTFFEVYYKLVPHVYTPEPSVLSHIIQAIELSGRLQYIPQIWSDMIMFEQTSRENLMEPLLNVMGSNKMEMELQEQFMSVVSDIIQRVDSHNLNRAVGGFQWTGHMMGNAMVVYLNGDNYAKACEIFTRCVTDQNKISGSPRLEQLQQFGKAAIENKDTKRATSAVKYMVNAGYVEAADLAHEILRIENLDEKDTFDLNEVISGTITEKPEES